MKGTRTISGPALSADRAGREQEEWLSETLRHVRETQFGQVTLTIHQGEVIEVQKTEKRRFARPRKES
ncbi:MAG: DUF2292 domain-containing protein [Oceanipulchritudo sp.]